MAKSPLIPPMIRILPMDKGEFNGASIKDVQKDYFIEDLPFRNPPGKYNRKKGSMKAAIGTIVLFQYDNAIVAAAELVGSREFASRKVNKITGEKYYGAHYFDPTSITTFNPINSDEIRGIWHEPFTDFYNKQPAVFSRFGLAKWSLDPKKIPQFLELLENKNPQYLDAPSFENAKFKKHYLKSGIGIKVKRVKFGIEGKDHYDLKICLANNPQKLGLKKIVYTYIEYTFKTKHRADIVFRDSSKNYTVVEVETNNPFSGIEQVIKYQKLLAGPKKIFSKRKKIKGILVSWNKDEEVAKTCKKLNIDYRQHKL